MIEEAVEERRDIPAGHGADGSFEIARGRASPSVLFQVRLNALAKLRFADPVLEHLDHGGAFLVRNVVESIRDIVVAFDRLADFAR